MGDPWCIPATDVGFHVAELVAGNAPLGGTVLHYFVGPASVPQPTPPALDAAPLPSDAPPATRIDRRYAQRSKTEPTCSDFASYGG